MTDCSSFPGHVQVSQVPDRDEPWTEGEIDFDKVFKELVDSKYIGFVGFEYKPRKTTCGGLQELFQSSMKNYFSWK